MLDSQAYKVSVVELDLRALLEFREPMGVQVCLELTGFQGRLVGKAHQVLAALWVLRDLRESQQPL